MYDILHINWYYKSIYKKKSEKMDDLEKNERIVSDYYSTIDNFKNISI